MRRTVLAGLVIITTACGGQAIHQDTPGAVPASTARPTPGTAELVPVGDGTSATAGGYTLVPASTTVPVGMPSTFTFHITGPNGATVTRFPPEQTNPAHFYLIRTDLSGYTEPRSTMSPDGTWHTDLPALAPGSYRAYVSFAATDLTGWTTDYVLAQPLTAPGTGTSAPLPAPTRTAQVDGYTLTLAGHPMSGMVHPIVLMVSRGSTPVTDLEPDQGSYAQLNAFHAGDQAFAHPRPRSGATDPHGGPNLTFDTEFPASGDWRLYVRFHTGGVPHTAAFTMRIS